MVTEYEIMGVGAFWLVMAVVWIILAFPLSVLFKEAGEKPWKAFIPFVSGYTETKMVFGKKRAWWFLSDFLLGGLFSCYLLYNEAKAFSRSSKFAVCHLLFPFVTYWMLAFGERKYKGPQKFLLDD